MIHVLGAGSLGLLWATRLARQAIPVTLLLRDQSALTAWIERQGMVTLQEADGRSRLHLPAETADANIHITHLILATKAYSAVEALRSVAGRLAADCQVLMLQNGMGAQGQVRADWPNLHLLYASVTDGAWLASPGHVVWAGRGLCRIGSADGSAAPQWLEWLRQAGIDWVWENDIQAVLWQKLAINCAINPLSVLHDCSNGEVPARAGARFEELVLELEALLARVGCGLEPGELTRRIGEVIERTAANSSSMRQDINARRRTEVDFILGHAQREASHHGLAMPVLDGVLTDLQTQLAKLGLPID